MFWKVTGFSQPSPIETILDKEEFTLEELLEEDDLVQECKSLNGRLVAFLRERSTVEQLIKYLVEAPSELDDPKRTYKYPFTACEVFCCEVEAVFNTLLEDADLMRLLFSLLDSEPPLACKTAGYFGRVVGQLLLRKTNEMMQYLQENSHILEKLITHIDTTSVSDIVKRLVGADEQPSILFMPAYAQWLADTPLVDLLLHRLGPGHTAEVQANAAEILSAIAHTQPSPLAAKLTREECISALFQHALQPGRAVLVPALDVCIALIEPKRSNPELLSEGSPMQDAARRAKAEAVSAIVAHLPSLMALLQQQQESTVPSETTYGTIAPPLGRARLKVVELLSVLLRSSDETAERAMMASNSLPVCLDLFRTYPFNNLLHHSVTGMVLAALTRPSEAFTAYLFEQCHLLDWLTSLPVEVRPTPRGQTADDPTSPRPALRAGYMGHLTQLGGTLEAVAGVRNAPDVPHPQEAAIAAYISSHVGWQQWRDNELRPRQELENVMKWQCGRPAATDLAGIDSDGDEYQNDMDLGEIQGMQPALYHRYNAVNEDDEDDDDGDEAGAYSGSAMFDAGGDKYGAPGDENDGTTMMTEALSGMDINDTPMDTGAADTGMQAQMVVPGTGVRDIDDDEVLLATSDDDDTGAAPLGSRGTSGAPSQDTAASLSTDDLVMVDDEALPEAQPSAVQVQQPDFGSEPTWKPTWPVATQDT